MRLSLIDSHRTRTFLCFAALFSYLSPQTAQSQTSTGNLSVTILDSSGGAIPNTTLKLIGSETGNVLRTIQTNETGVAAISLVPPGLYDLSAAAPGFKSTLRRSVQLDAGSVV